VLRGDLANLAEGLWERDERAFYTFNGATIAQREIGGETRLLHGDHLGSVRLLTVAGAHCRASWGSPESSLPESTTTTRN
jgi:hypothetical protein